MGQGRATPSGLISVAVPVPRLDALTYRVPEPFPTPAVGARVLVPLGSRELTGCVLATDVAPAAELAVKDIVDVLDEEPFLPPDVLGLVGWVAEYYLCGWGDALAAAVPPGVWIESDRIVAITTAGRAAMETLTSPRGAILRALAPRGPQRVTALARTRRRREPAGTRRGDRPRARLATLVAALARRGLVTVRHERVGRPAAFKTVPVAQLTDRGRDARTAGRLTPRQRQALDLLARAPEGLVLRALAAQGVAPSVVRRLAARDLVRLEQLRIERRPAELDRDPGADMATRETPLVLTEEQQDALERLLRLADEARFRVVLLHGVTGSGKTELYLRLAEAIRARGRGVLVLVPEIALTPAAVAAFRRALGERVAIQHSGLSWGERYDQWHQIRAGAVDIVVGTRSAVFAPLPALGLVIVDEEHDASYKQETPPRYHARDVAIVRAQRAGALVVLGSATPSLETYANALAGRYERIVLSRRVLDRPLAGVTLVDMRREFALAGPEVVLSEPLRHALASCLRQREQALVLLNRRGFAVAVFCRDCAGTLECPNCSVALTVHRATRRAHCHYCNYAVRIPRTCPRCQGEYLEQIGFGTERVEAELRRAFPTARVARLDRDTVRRRGALVTTLQRFARGEIDVLVGTQMIAKGHDFPGVTLVGVVSADVGLGLADFRAAERTFQLLTQVAGRAGRGDKPGQAIVQTLYPNHYSIRHACRQDYAAFYADELAFRRALRYPPAVALINVVVHGRSFDVAMADAAALVARLRAAGRRFRVLGPAPAPLGRLRGQHRAQLFLKGTDRRAMRETLRAVLAERPELGRRVTVDVDPLSVL